MDTITVRDRMTTEPVVLDSQSTIADAARRMRDHDIGDVLVELDGGDDYGIVTDRDITVRAVAAGFDPEQTTIGNIATTDLEAVGPEDEIDDVIGRMRVADVRRIPVLEEGEPVGILSLGDLAVMRDQESVLADISAAPGNN